MILISFIFAIVLCGASAAAVNDTANETQDSIGCTADPIINGTVTINEYGHIRPLQGATVTVNTTASNSRILGTATTDENGYYSIGFYSTDTTFRVTSSYIGCDNITRTVNVSPGPDYPTDPNYYGTANIEMTPKTATLTGTGNGRNVYIQGQDKTGFAGVINVRVDGNTYQAYCIDLFTPINIGDVLLVNGPLPGTAGDLPGGVDWGKVTYIINNYNPSSSNNEAAAIQCAIWYFTSLHYGPYGGPNPIPGYYQFMTAPNDGRRDGPSGSTVVRDRAWEIINAAISMQYPYSITLAPETVKIPNGGQVNLTATVQDQNGNPLQGITVQFRKDKGTLSQNSGITDVNGQVSVRLSNIPNGSTAVVTAYVTGNYGNLLYDDQYSTPRKQNLVARNLLPLILSSISIINTDATANVELTQTANSPVNVGDIINYIVTATNHGPSTATGIMIEDIIPAGLSNVTVTPSLGTYYNGVWVIPSLANSAAATLTINGTATSAIAGTDITNTATRIAQDQYNSLSNTTSATAHVKKADVAITQTVNGASSATVNVGDAVTYLVTANNNGPDAATGLKITDLMPEGLSNIVYSASAGLYDLNTGLWNIGTLINGASTTLNITGTVTSAWAGLNITNYANRTAQTEYNSLPAVAAADVYTKKADLVITNTVNSSDLNVGQTGTFTVTVTNNGPNAATNIKINDLLPGGFTAGTPTAGSYNGSVWAIDSLASGSSATITFTATLTPAMAGMNITNNGNATWDEYPKVVNISDATIHVKEANVVITNTANSSSLNVGDTAVFTVTVTNNGEDPATNIRINTPLPAGFTVDTHGVGSYSEGIWTIDSLAKGSTATLTFTGVLQNSTAGTNIINHVTETHDEYPFTVNVSDASFYVKKADVALSQVGNYSGNKVTFVVTATNNGPDTATNINIRNLIPTGLTGWVVTPSVGTYDSVTGIWNIESLLNGTFATLNITGNATPQTTIINNVTLNNQTEFNSNISQNIIKLVYVPSADVRITIYTTTGKYNNWDVNNDVTWAVDLINSGPDDAHNIIATVTLPIGLDFMGADARSNGIWTYNSLTRTLTWNLAFMPSGGAASLDLLTYISKSGNLTITATKTSQTENDPNTSNNARSRTLPIPQQVDIQVTQTVNNLEPSIGETIVYTITAINNGPDNAKGVSIKDLLPLGLTFVSADTHGIGTYNNNTGIWTIGNFNNGQTATLTITAIVNNINMIKNTAKLETKDQFDWNFNNNAQTTIINQGSYVPSADVRITIYTTTGKYNNWDVNNDVTWAVDLINSGPDDAHNIIATVTLPIGLDFMGADARSNGIWTYNSLTRTLTWNLAFMPSGGAASLDLLTYISKSGNLTITATKTSQTENDPNTSNNARSRTLPIPQQVDIQVTQTVNNLEPSIGETIVYTITAINNGPDNAKGVSIKDLLPLGLTFVSADTHGIGTYNNNTGIWTIGNFNNGQTATLTITAIVNNGTSNRTIINNAALLAKDQFDWNFNNNSQKTYLNVISE
jgi:uncharacterized repeat protein (TIGR01451 family)